MDTSALLADLRARGIALRVSGGTLLANPSSLLVADDRAAIAAAKGELVLWLLAESAQGGDVDAMTTYLLALADYEAAQVAGLPLEVLP